MMPRRMRRYSPRWRRRPITGGGICSRCPCGPTRRTARTDLDVDELLRHLYELGVIVPFNWPDWYSPDRFRGGQGLESASVADAVRLITSYVRGDRFSDGALAGGLIDGSIPAAIGRLWTWYRGAVAGDEEFVDRADYSPDGLYRWSYERRWAPGGTLCWVGLNPGTGDRDAGPRPTLRRVVAWAKARRLRGGHGREPVLLPLH